MAYDFDLNHNMDTMKTPNCIDECWSEIFEMSPLSGANKYCILEKLANAALCFHWPVVERAFNLVEFTITNHRTILNVEGLDNYQTIKYYLKAKDVSSLEEFYSTECPETHPIEKHLLTNWPTTRKNVVNIWKQK